MTRCQFARSLIGFKDDVDGGPALKVVLLRYHFDGKVR